MVDSEKLFEAENEAIEQARDQSGFDEDQFRAGFQAGYYAGHSAGYSDGMDAALEAVDG